jgi:hypothetical protein
VAREAPTGGGTQPEAGRPRMFGGHLEPVRLPWRWATERLTEARRYWIATTRPSGRPHSRPVWGVWLDDRFYFSTGSLAAVNLVSNAEITVHTDNATDVLIIEGVAEIVADQAIVDRVIGIYNEKYGWDADPRAMPGPLYAVVPRVVFGWIADDTGLDRGSAFHGTATRWRLA